MRASRGYRYSDAAAKSRPLRVITVRARPGHPSQGILRAGSLVLPCALGKNGISSAKREGDGATPLGTLRVLSGYFRARTGADMQPLRSRLPMRPIAADLGWCDAPADRNYNRPVHLPYSVSHERMQRSDRLYDTVLVLDWNVSVRKRNKGSAIFLHLARQGFQPTEGCVAVSRRGMTRLLPLLTRETRVRILR